jgi:hypothetical protein
VTWRWSTTPSLGFCNMSIFRNCKQLENNVSETGFVYVLTFFCCTDQELVDLCIHFPIRLHYQSTVTGLPVTPTITESVSYFSYVFHSSLLVPPFVRAPFLRVCQLGAEHNCQLLSIHPFDALQSSRAETSFHASFISKSF